MGMKKSLSLGIIALVLAQLPALPSQAEICEGNFCEVSFNFSGEVVAWQVPAGVNEVSFEIAGASGGRGGLGGTVTGKITDLPQTLYLAVGQLGAIGSQAPGGFNGGGSAGGFRTNEGAGGGASDIRFGPELADRVVVAGGGGGAGGFSGAPGGPGGERQAANGQNGQGGGGGGGGQTQGGAAGTSNGGTAATSGSFGFGGTGGNSTNAGGGGGGGGWYGGGGGGADTDNCCADGGGGGGGSSYANPNYSLDVEHQAGVQLGDGYIRLSYVKQQSVQSFTAQQNLQQIDFELKLVLPQELGIEDFDTSSLRCDLLELSRLGATVNITAGECEHGFQQLSIASALIGGGSEQSSVIASLEFDALAPLLSWELLSVDHLDGSAVIDYSLSEGTLEVSILGVVGCELVEVAESQIQLGLCGSAEVLLMVEPLSLADAHGNAGPEGTQSLNLYFDQVAPQPSFSNLITDVEAEFHSVELTFSEPSSFDVERLELTGPEQCQFMSEQFELGFRLSATCGAGDYEYLLPANSIVDAVGNAGPTADVRFGFSISEPIPTEVAAPVPPAEFPPAEPQPPVLAAPEPPATNEVVPIVAPPAPPFIATPSEPEVEPTPADSNSENPLENEPAFISPAPSGSNENGNDSSALEEEPSTLVEIVEPQEQASGLESDPPGFIAETVGDTPVTQANAQDDASQNLIWVVLLGVGAIGLSGYFGYRLIGR